MYSFNQKPYKFMSENLISLNKKIISCRNCKRLVDFREKIANDKRKQYLNENYWGKPVPGYGEKDAQILILGLAPAAHGANRTGRVFTGDKSSEFLFRCLHKSNISNKSNSINKDDLLKLNNTYITLALKCVPPNDKPTSNELKNCFKYFKEELDIFKNIKVIVALGKIAFDTCLVFFKLRKRDFLFKHGKEYLLNKKQFIIACYHPSPRNVNTKRLDEASMLKVFTKAKKLMKTTP